MQWPRRTGWASVVRVLLLIFGYAYLAVRGAVRLLVRLTVAVLRSVRSWM